MAEHETMPTPVYTTAATDADLELAEEDVELRTRGKVIAAKCKAIVQLRPEARLRFVITVPGGRGVTGWHEHVDTLRFTERNVAISAWACGLGDRLVLAPFKDPVTALGGGNTRLKEARFHLVNFPDYVGEAVVRDQRKGRLDKAGGHRDAGWELDCEAVLTPHDEAAPRTS